MDAKARIKETTARFLTSISDLIQKEVENGIRERLSAALDGGITVQRSSAQRSSTPRRKLDMACRWGDCKNRSKGPRFHFMCEEHLKSFQAKAKRQEKAAKEA